MTKIKAYAVFDIGKTNKKFFLFDQNYNEIDRKYIELPLIEDEDGHPTENLDLLQSWVRGTFHEALDNPAYHIQSVNFSTYGASLVHLDRNNQVLTPLYNYTKPLDRQILDKYYQQYGNELKIAAETASPQSGMLNSGLQLFWLKEKYPEKFSRIKTTLHFPQFLSWMFTKIPLSEYTSIGCHTNLWDFRTNEYHNWVKAEELDRVLAPIVPTSTSINTCYEGISLRIGIGIHDSSAALLPYFLTSDEPFLLISTGTWSISLNPFSREVLSEQDIRDNCLNYLRTDGRRVKATRFFMGNAYKEMVQYITRNFDKDYGYHKTVRFDPEVFNKLTSDKSDYFNFDQISPENKVITTPELSDFGSFEQAYHKMMMELVDIQVKKVLQAKGTTDIKTIFVDGGFTENDVFMNLLSHHFENYKILSTEIPLGSALGAALISSEHKMEASLLREKYKLKAHKPPVLN